MTRRIPLTKGQFALVDDADYEVLSKHSWYASGVRFYAARRRKDNERNPRKLVYMHRELLGVESSSLHVDHINGNRLDNRRSNLRIVTVAENAQNTTRAISPGSCTTK